MTDDQIMDAAIDGEDWPTAALCVLANPCSSQFARGFVRELAAIAFGQPGVENPDRKVIAALKIIEAMEAQRDA